MNSVLHDSNFFRGLFTITAVSVLLGLFELVLYVTVAAPMELAAIRGLLASLDKPQTATAPFFLQGDAVVRAAAHAEALYKTKLEREREMMDVLNRDSIMFMTIVLLVLCGVLVLIYVRIRQLAAKEPLGTNLRASGVHILITTCVLAAFQYQMFLYGQNFKYTGALGMEEINTVIYHELETLVVNNSTERSAPSPR